MTEEKIYRVPAVQRAFALLEFIADSPSGVRMMDASVALGLPKSSTFGLLTVLEELGYVTRDHEGVYRLGSRLSELAATARRNVNMPEIARPVLVALADSLRLTTHLASLDGPEILYLDKVDTGGLVRFDTYVGKRAPAHLTAVGKALLATWEDSEIERVLSSRLRRGTERSPSALDELLAQVADTRSRGWALEDQEEVEGVRCVAAPILREDGRGVAAIGCIGLVTQLSDEVLPTVATAVQEAAAALSAELQRNVPAATR